MVATVCSVVGCLVILRQMAFLTDSGEAILISAVIFGYGLTLPGYRRNMMGRSTHLPFSPETSTLSTEGCSGSRQGPLRPRSTAHCRAPPTEMSRAILETANRMKHTNTEGFPLGFAAFASFAPMCAIACSSLLEQGFEAQGEDGHAEGSDEREGEQDKHVG